MSDWHTRPVGQILKDNDFPKQILLVADQNTLKAADGILESLADFSVELHIYDNLRVADMEHVYELEEKIRANSHKLLSPQARAAAKAAGRAVDVSADDFNDAD